MVEMAGVVVQIETINRLRVISKAGSLSQLIPGGVGGCWSSSSLLLLLIDGVFCCHRRTAMDNTLQGLGRSANYSLDAARSMEVKVVVMVVLVIAVLVLVCVTKGMGWPVGILLRIVNSEIVEVPRQMVEIMSKHEGLGSTPW
jgi:hypothetical protein